MSKESFLERIKVKLKKDEETVIPRKEEIIDGIKVVYTGEKKLVPDDFGSDFAYARCRLYGNTSYFL